MNQPNAPPARPHSAHAYMAVPTIFRTTSGRSVPSRPALRNSARGSLSSNSIRQTEWEDAWDSSSDREDDEAPATSARAAPIPIRASRMSPTASGLSHSGGNSGSISTSWVSASYHPTPVKATPPAGGQPAHRAVVDTENGAAAPESKLGAWEMVEPAEAEEEGRRAAGREALRADCEDVLRDPMQLLAGLTLSSAPGSPRASPSFGSRAPSGRASPRPGSGISVSRQRSVRTERRRDKFAKILSCDTVSSVDIGALKRLAWNGVPEEVRPIVWQLLLNYLPLPLAPRLVTLTRKRKEYAALVEQYFGRGPAFLDQQIWHQIEIDVPRTRPGAPLWSCSATQRALERILYVWAIRHPASGYVQGINDLATPFFEVFLSAYVSVDPERFDVSHLPRDVLAAVEADSFWCLTKLLDGIQDHYISQQPGIQRLVKRMGELVKRIDSPLATHFEDQGVEYMQFAFRWMNCLLMREISVKCTIRMWDSYLSEGADAFSQFHLYVCCALLVKFSDKLRDMDFQEMIIFLQRLPTNDWGDNEIELLLSEAFVLKSVWQGADNHFANLPMREGLPSMMGR
ncbi:hypothetical protein CspHIS471_0209240 [Cutaneotrichosporon sp. HIS471]|nr:hypothetical protein CspHIS471_0209240 [Cutaneotrichosporon sp. HIS471]